MSKNLGINVLKLFSLLLKQPQTKLEYLSLTIFFFVADAVAKAFEAFWSTPHR
jgi:hypothetical protein